jgi:hypothetical protein
MKKKAPRSKVVIRSRPRWSGAGEQNESISDDTRGRVHGGGAPSVVVAGMALRSAVAGSDCDGR